MDRTDRAVGARVIALATSQRIPSVARASWLPGEGVRSTGIGAVAVPQGDPSADLLSSLAELVSPRALRDGEIDAIAFEVGPGAFTGLRVGCAIAQGLALAAGLPVVPVGTLDAVALRRVQQAGLARALVLVANDARMGELYVGVCAVENRTDCPPSVQPLVASGLARPDDAGAREFEQRLLESCSAASSVFDGWPWLAAGDAWHTVEMSAAWSALAGHDGTALQQPPPALQGLAGAVGELACGLWLAGGGLDAAAAEPHYVRDRVALDLNEQRRLRAAAAVASALS